MAKIPDSFDNQQMRQIAFAISKNHEYAKKLGASDRLILDKMLQAFAQGNESFGVDRKTKSKILGIHLKKVESSGQEEYASTPSKLRQTAIRIGKGIAHLIGASVSARALQRHAETAIKMHSTRVDSQIQEKLGKLKENSTNSIEEKLNAALDAIHLVQKNARDPKLLLEKLKNEELTKSLQDDEKAFQQFKDAFEQLKYADQVYGGG